MVSSSTPPHAGGSAARRDIASIGLRHALALVLYAGLAVALTWPLAAKLRTHIPGTALDDNAMFLWNFWWLRRALADPAAGFFTTNVVFHPADVNLVLHSHSLLNAFAGATLFGALPLQMALNLTLLAGCALNGFAAYVLALRVSGQWPAAIVAGALFAASPVFAVHLFGHFNYYTAWPLVGFIIVWLDATRRPSWWSALVAGAALAAVAYADYYYFVYALVFAGLVSAGRACDVDLAPRAAPVTALDRILIALAAVAIAIAVLVRVSGGGAWQVGPVLVSLKAGTNVRAIGAALLVWWAWRRRSWRLTAQWHRQIARHQLFVVCGTGAAGALLMAPILYHAWRLVAAGQYVTQTYLWRSAPGGIDIAGVIAGNPFNPLWGVWVRRLYDALGMDTFNDPLWLGLAPLILLLTRRGWMAVRVARRWLLVTLVFLVWALGPFLTVFGLDTGLPLPQILLRYVPVVSNARIPAHAAVMVCLGAAVLLAVAMSRSRRLRSSAAAAGLLAVILVDLNAAPFPLTPLVRPPLYERLATMPAGAVLDVPTGIRDGFGPIGVFDASVLYFQTIHEKPIVTGYIARLPPAVRERYARSPAMRTLFQLSAGEPSNEPPLDPAAARSELSGAWHVRYLVIHDRSASPAVRSLVEAMGLRLIDHDESRRLYLISDQ